MKTISFSKIVKFLILILFVCIYTIYTFFVLLVVLEFLFDLQDYDRFLRVHSMSETIMSIFNFIFWLITSYLLFIELKILNTVFGIAKREDISV
jgi:hypothetical protein